MESPITLPQPKSAPMCEQCAPMTQIFPLRVRKATSCRPRMRLDSGFVSSCAWQNKYHEAGCAGKLLAGGGGSEKPVVSESGFWMRLLMTKPVAFRFQRTLDERGPDNKPFRWREKLARNEACIAHLPD